MGKRKPLRNSGQKSQKRARADSDSSSEEEAADIRLDQSTGEPVSMTFEFRDMQSAYWDGVKTLLTQLMPNALHIGDVANTITEQAAVGTVVSNEGGEDVFAFATLLPLSQLSEHASLQQILTDLTSSLSSNQTLYSPYADALNSDATALMMQSRFCNMPLQLVEPLHRNMLEDLQWASKDSEYRELFGPIKQLLHFAPASMTENIAKGAAIDVTGRSSVIYENFEDEVYAQHADVTVLFRPQAFASAVAVSIVPVKKLQTIFREIGNMVPPL